MSNRYDAIREKIARDFSRTVTVSPDLAGGAIETVFNIDDHDETYMLDSRFEKFAPFNACIVNNQGNTDVKVYINKERTAFYTIGSGERVNIKDVMPQRYIRYLRISNEDGANANNDVELQIGTEVDSVELDVLKMAGQLDISDSPGRGR